MSKEGFIIRLEDGSEEFVYYDEIDPELLPQLLRPAGVISWRAEDFKRLPLAQQPFYVEPWLPRRGKCMIYAPAKSGKSTLCIQMARCIGVGLPFLGLPTVQGRVLYFQHELGMEVLQQRMNETGQTYDDVYVATTFSMKLDTEPGQHQMLAEVDAVRPGVLIIDPFYKVLKGDENESLDVRVVLDFLDSLTDEPYRCSIVLIHHPGKDITKGGRGSSVLEDWVDAYIEMKQISKGNDPLKVRITPKLLRHAPLPETNIEAVLEDGEFVLTTDPTTIKGRVLAIIKSRADAKRTTTADILTDGSLGSKKGVYNAVDELMRAKVIERVARGEYKLAGGG